LAADAGSEVLQALGVSESWADFTSDVTVLVGSFLLGRPGKGINQLNKLVKIGKAPKSIKRFDLGKVKGELNHVHFDNGAALNINGTWKHGSKVLTNKEIKFLQENGWTIPK
jgi:hypothetical protein